MIHDRPIFIPFSSTISNMLRTSGLFESVMVDFTPAPHVPEPLSSSR